MAVAAIAAGCGGAFESASERGDESWRLKRPRLSKPRPIALPSVETFELSNRVRVVMVSRSEFPIVALRVVVTRGAVDAPPGRAVSYAHILQRGTRRRSHADFATEMYELGGNYQVNAGYDATILKMKVLATKVRDAFDLLYELTAEPTFPIEEVERWRELLLAGLLDYESDPAHLCSSYVRRAVYPEASPYARTLWGSEADVRATSRDDLSRLRTQWIRPENITLVVAGATTKRELAPQLERRFGKLRAAGAAAARAAVAPMRDQPAGSPRVILVDQAGGALTHVAVSALGGPQDDPDRAALSVLNQTLSGRIYAKLRAERGYAYDSSTAFERHRGAGHFVSGGAMATPHSGAALRAILTELARAREERLSHTAIVLGANRIESGISKGHETVGDTADAYAALVEHGLPLDWQSRFIREIRATDSIRIRNAAARQLAPERLRVVVVGDAAQVRPQLEQLGFGPIELHVARRTSPTPKPPPPPNVTNTGP